MAGKCGGRAERKEKEPVEERESTQDFLSSHCVIENLMGIRAIHHTEGTISP